MTDRRSFVGIAGGALMSAAVAPSFLLRRRAQHDLIIRGGTMFDGTGTEGREMDVAISGALISGIAPTIGERGKEEIDARGLAASPGFIDIHSHGDGNLAEDPRVESVVRQGITTMVVGADGSSRANGSPEKSFAAM